MLRSILSAGGGKTEALVRIRQGPVRRRRGLLGSVDCRCRQRASPPNGPPKQVVVVIVVVRRDLDMTPVYAIPAGLSKPRLEPLRDEIRRDAAFPAQRQRVAAVAEAVFDQQRAI